ncbi:MAG: hypothetical protein OHK0037_20410 [Elainellaceae cyanobacterium]
MPDYPCGGDGGIPRPGADPYAYLLYVDDVVMPRDFGDLFSDTFLQEENGQTYIDPGNFQEWLDDRTPIEGDGRLRNRPPIWTPDERGFGFAALSIEDFCRVGPPTEDEISPTFPLQVRRIASWALTQRWLDNCVCRTPAPERGLCPVPYYFEWQLIAVGRTISTDQTVEQGGAVGALYYGPITNIEFTQDSEQITISFQCHGELPFGDATEIPLGRTETPVTRSQTAVITDHPNLVPESIEWLGRVNQFYRWDGLPDNCGPPVFPPPPFAPGRTINPPFSDFPPLPDPPPVIFIPRDCQFTQECKNQLRKVHELMGPDEFPAKLPETLFDPSKEGQKEYKNYAELMEWLIVQIDGLMGEFPIDIKYRDIEGKKQSIKIENLSEAIAEQLGLLLNIAADAEIAVQLGFKGTTEAIRALNAATLAADYAKSNADFLGYRSKNYASDIKLSITPGDKTLKGALSESAQKIQRYKFDDSQDLQDFLKQLIIGVGIIKAAFYRPLNQRDLLPGEQIRQDRNPDENGLTNDDREWEEFLNQIEEPLSRQRRDENLPKPKVEDIDVRTQDSRNQTDRERQRRQSQTEVS